MRSILLDTETTGINKDDRIIELAAVELGSSMPEKETIRYVEQLNDEGSKAEFKREGIFHYYLNPHKKSAPAAQKIHGISDSFLLDKPDFSSIAKEFEEFIRDAILIIHNAPFDLYYLNFEFALMSQRTGSKFVRVEDMCYEIKDTLVIAQSKYPGQSNSLDSLLARFGIDARVRDKGHGALIDAQLLARVYESMCLNQSGLDFNLKDEKDKEHKIDGGIREMGPFRLVPPSDDELKSHDAIMKKLSQGRSND